MDGEKSTVLHDFLKTHDERQGDGGKSVIKSCSMKLITPLNRFIEVGNDISLLNYDFIRYET